MNQELDRRDFLKGAALAGASVVGLGGITACSSTAQPSSSSQPENVEKKTDSVSSEYAIPSSQTYETYKPEFSNPTAFVEEPIGDNDIINTETFDVVVCGGGISGIATAASAAENGLSVVLVEKGEAIAVHGTEVGALNSKVQLAANIELDPMQFIEDALFSSSYRASFPLYKVYAYRSGEAMDWLIDLLDGAAGDPAFAKTTNTVAAGVTNWATTIRFTEGNAAVFNGILNYAISKGADIRYSTPAVQLIKTNDGKIDAVVIKTADGYVKLEANTAVVLATGSYEYNWDRMKYCMRQRDLSATAYLNPTITDTGDGHLMGLAVGAIEDEYPHVTMGDPAGDVISHVRASGAMKPFLRVNSAGERFTNEQNSFEYITNAIMSQPGGTDWLVTDSNIYDHFVQMKETEPWPPEKMQEDFMVNALQADTLEDLALKMNVPAESFIKAVERNNEIIRLGIDEDFRKDIRFVTPIDTPPFYALKEGATVLVTVSGLLVNDRSEVLDKSGVGIPGLYAIGNVSGGMFNDTYPHHLNGISHGRCLTFGYLLGRRLAGIEA
jgi:succinate dehydrogenase/fumarate reductase flavoprotein subunit